MRGNNQNLFVDNWNQVAAIAEEKYQLHLPELDQEGICVGLSYAHIFYAHHQLLDLFYKFMDMVCNDYTPLQIAQSIKNNDRFADLLVNFVVTIGVLQDKEYKNFSDNVRTPAYFANNQRIGAHSEGKTKIILLENVSSIRNLIGQLNVDEGFVVSSNWHVWDVCRISSSQWSVFNANKATRREFDDVNNAASFLLLSIRDLDDSNSFINFNIQRLFTMSIHYVSEGLFCKNEETITTSWPIPILVSFLSFPSNNSERFEDEKIVERNTFDFELQNLSNAEAIESLGLMAIFVDDPDLLDQLLQRFPSLDVNQFWCHNLSIPSKKSLPLHVAVRVNSVKIVILLLQKYNAKIDIYGKDGFTILIKAVLYCWSNLAVEALLKGGANPNLKDKTELGMSPLQAAVTGNNYVGVKLLLQYAAEVDEAGEIGSTALMGASFLGLKKMVDLLLLYGADVNFTDSDGDTALDEAIFGASLNDIKSPAHNEIVELLRLRKAKVSHRQARHDSLEEGCFEKFDRAYKRRNDHILWKQRTHSEGGSFDFSSSESSDDSSTESLSNHSDDRGSALEIPVDDSGCFPFFSTSNSYRPIVDDGPDDQSIYLQEIKMV